MSKIIVQNSNAFPSLFTNPSNVVKVGWRSYRRTFKVSLKLKRKLQYWKTLKLSFSTVRKLSKHIEWSKYLLGFLTRFLQQNLKGFFLFLTLVLIEKFLVNLSHESRFWKTDLRNHAGLLLTELRHISAFMYFIFSQ